MENVELIKQLVVLFDQVKVAKTLVDDGKEVACSRQLQGAKTRCLHLLEWLQLEEKSKNVVAHEDKSERPNG